MMAAPAFRFAPDMTAFDHAVFHARRANEYRQQKKAMVRGCVAGLINDDSAGVLEGRARFHENRVRKIALRAEIAHQRAAKGDTP